MCTPERDDNKIDGRRSCKLKIPSLNGGFLVPSSISKVNRKRENWIRTDAECKSRCYSELIYSILFLSLSLKSFHIVCLLLQIMFWNCEDQHTATKLHWSSQSSLLSNIYIYIYTYLQNHCLVMCSEIVRVFRSRTS